MKRLLKLSFFLSFFLLGFFVFAPKFSPTNAASCTNTKYSCSTTITFGGGGESCPSGTATVTDSACSSPHFCCKPPCSSTNTDGYCLNPGQTCTYDSYGGSWYCKTATAPAPTCRTAGQSCSPSLGACCSEYSCSGTLPGTCVANCSSTATNGYCPSGTSCQKEDNIWKCVAPSTDCVAADCASENGGTGCQSGYTCNGTRPNCTCNSGSDPGSGSEPAERPTIPTNDCYYSGCDSDTGTFDINAVCDGDTCETAIGPINTTDFGGFAKSLFSVLLSIAGVIATILIIISGYKLVLSRGNPEKVQDAREQLTSAIVGLLFIIFSLVFLEFIGLDILGIPKFF